MVEALDKIDRQMIDLLKKNGRMTNVELAERVGLSPPPCLRRLRFLESEKVITGYEAKIDTRKLGYEIQAILIVNLVSHKAKVVSRFLNIMKEIDCVQKIESTIGTSEFIITLVANDLIGYGQFLKNYIQDNDDINSFKSYIIDNVEK